ncbi:MAG: PEP-CTERM sorting domain-containing protein, partial [Phycisphaerae bacterium]
ADGIPGGGDDLSLMSEQFSATNVAWNFHPRPLGISTGNPLLLEFAAIFSAGGSLGAGNFLDAVGFGENVPEPGTFALLMLGAGVCCRRRRRA